MSKWIYQCRESFNPDQDKQAQEVIFSKKTTKLSYPQITYNNFLFACVSFQDHLGIYLIKKLNFNCILRKKYGKQCRQLVLSKN